MEIHRGHQIFVSTNHYAFMLARCGDFWEFLPKKKKQIDLFHVKEQNKLTTINSLSERGKEVWFHFGDGPIPADPRAVQGTRNAAHWTGSTAFTDKEAGSRHAPGEVPAPWLRGRITPRRVLPGGSTLCSKIQGMRQPYWCYVIFGCFSLLLPCVDLKTTNYCWVLPISVSIHVSTWKQLIRKCYCIPCNWLQPNLLLSELLIVWKSVLKLVHPDFVRMLCSNGLLLTWRLVQVITVQPSLFLEEAVAKNSTPNLAAVLSFFAELTPSFKTTSDYSRYRHILSEMVWTMHRYSAERFSFWCSWGLEEACNNWWLCSPCLKDFYACTPKSSLMVLVALSGFADLAWLW